jgi:hypothetical protein
MSMDDITLLIAVDEGHFAELDFSIKKWKKYKPELYNMKKVLVFDSKIYHNISRLDLTNCRYHIFDRVSEYESQREAMLTSFFDGLSKVDTKYFIKIDTDCYGNNSDNGWIDAISDRGKYVFISSPWGYTKGPQMIYNLEDWSDRSDYFSGTKRLGHKHKEGSNKIIHSRIISFFYLGDTEWTKEIASLCHDGEKYKLPCPSQDTFCWYCAERLGKPYKKVKFKRFGFSHGNLWKNMRNISL